MITLILSWLLYPYFLLADQTACFFKLFCCFTSINSIISHKTITFVAFKAHPADMQNIITPSFSLTVTLIKWTIRNFPFIFYQSRQIYHKKDGHPPANFQQTNTCPVQKVSALIFFPPAETNEARVVCCGREVKGTFMRIRGFVSASRQRQSRAVSVWVRVYTHRASHCYFLRKWRNDSSSGIASNCARRLATAKWKPFGRFRGFSATMPWASHKLRSSKPIQRWSHVGGERRSFR